MTKGTVVVTGCSDGGLGAALALALHTAGWRVFATARKLAKLSSVRAAGIETLALDVLSQDSLSTAVASITDLTGGSLDALVNNAGVGLSMPIADLSIEEGKKIFDVNVWSLVATTQAFLPLLLKAKSGALLVNHGSVAGAIGLPFQGADNASKAAANMLSENMRLELAPFGIKVIELRTGTVSSNFYTNVEANGLNKTLPEHSIYQIARGPVEDVMSGVIGGEHVKDQGQSAMNWAKEVVADLNKTHPPAIIWRGSGAGKVRLGSCLPHGISIEHTYSEFV